MKIGLVGTGRMGAAIVERLISVGHDVTVWNRTAAKLDALIAKGARRATTPAELAGTSDIIISILSNAEAIDAIYHGEQGMLSGDVVGKVFIEMSTVRPVTARALAERVKARGAAMVDCPVGGTVTPAREGKLFGFVGGDADDVARVKPVLDQMCRRVEHVGPIGSGASMKLAINLPLMVYYQALGEALVLTQPLCLSPERIIDIMSDTSGAPAVIKNRGPVIAAPLKGETVATNFEVDLIRKDLRTMIEEAAALGADSPVAKRALECYDQAAAAGLGDADGTILPAQWVKTARAG